MTSRNEFVLRGARTAPSNSTSSWPATTGVVRDVRGLPASYDLTFNGLVDASAVQYLSSIQAYAEQIEYLVWAANSSNLARIEDPSWATSAGAVSVPVGNRIVIDTSSPDFEGGTPVRRDGSSSVVLIDNDNRTVSDILSLTVVRGDDLTETEVTLTVPTDLEVLSPLSGLVQIRDNATTQTALQPYGTEPPAMSTLRGDRVVSVSYVLAAQRWWWTRNDSQQERFGWDGKVQRWRPFQGSGPIDLGQLLTTSNFSLSPRPSLSLGSYLPGSSAGDAYCMIRLGSTPSSLSYPVAQNPTGPWDGILVVTDESAETDFNFSPYSPPLAGVIGETSGKIQWNPSFVSQFAGQQVWYVYETFRESSNGVIGELLEAKDSDLFVAPVPQMTECPFIRIGSRTYLESLVVESDAELAVLVVPAGSVGVSSSTGKLKFNDGDIAKADPSDPSFSVSYLGASVVYDGMSLTRRPQPLREAVRAVNSAGVPETVGTSNVLYIPDASLLPGLGTSGVFHIPDGTGAIPSSGTPGVRPGGDNTGGSYTGLIRDLGDLGDILVFSKVGYLESLEIVDHESDLPAYPFDIPKGTVYIAKERSSQGSRVALGAVDRAAYSGEYLYYLNGHVTLASYTDVARIVSRSAGPYALDGTEVLYFSLDGSSYTWNASALGAGTYTADQIAVSLNAVIVGPGNASSLRGRIALQTANVQSGVVEIGFGPAAGTLDVSGASALGLVPGWRVDTGDSDTFWLADSGVSLGVKRSPGNLDGSAQTSDFKAYGRFDDETLQGSVSASPIVPLNQLPLRDFAGYDEDVFFRVQDGAFSDYQRNYEDLVYEFDEDRFVWVDKTEDSSVVQRATAFLQLSSTNVVTESLLEALGGHLQLSEGGPFQDLIYGEDFLMPQDGQSGTIVLFDRIGELKLRGERGSYTVGSSTFTDPVADFIAAGIGVGDRLKIEITGESYRVVQVLTPTSLQVEPSFYTGPGTFPVAWLIYQGYDTTVYDPSLVADVTYRTFNHLPDEPFVVRVYSALGPVPANPTEQSLNRLHAIMSDALNNGRDISLKFGLNGPEASMVGLTQTKLGSIANNSLYIPDVGSIRFNSEAFSIRLDTTTFQHGVDLIPVSSFSPTIASGTIEYLTSTGELGFAADLLVSYALGQVIYVEVYLDPTLLSSGVVEYLPEDGGVNLSNADMASYAGETAYFIEKMVTEDTLDVSLNPIGGSFGFRKPIREGQIVEAQYFQADVSGNLATDDDGNAILIKEFLPVYIRAEVCTRINPHRYSFNPTGRTVARDVEWTAYVDVYRMNYGSVETASVDFDQDLLHLVDAVDASLEVTLYYGVLEAFGGEIAYQTSVRPVYRPPFFLEVGQTQFTLVTDRTNDLYPGILLRLGANVFYVSSSSYNAIEDETTVEVYPSPVLEAGSRAPGHDVLTLISDRPVALEVDGTVVPASSPGFWQDVSQSYDPIRKGQKEVIFHTPALDFMVPGHLLEIDGVPTLITGTITSEDGLNLIVQTSFPFQHEVIAKPIRVSVRPVYPDGATALLGLGPVLASENHELVLFGEKDEVGVDLPGRTLANGIDYEINFDDGSISLISPDLGGFQRDREIYLSYTKIETVAPFLSNGLLIYPRYSAEYLYWSPPSEENGLLGLTLKATYTFYSPDTFYSRALTLSDYATEVASEIAEDASSQQTSGGALVVSTAASENYEEGNLGLESQLLDYLDHERAARYFLEVYHLLITSIEQVLENMSGMLIGQQDGKLRLFIGRGKDYAPPGYEDVVSGLLNRRNLFAEVFLAETLAEPVRVIETDYLVEPEGATVINAELTGTYLSPVSIERLTKAQSAAARNQVDDLVLIGRGPVQMIRSGLVRYARAQGRYEILGEANKLSRLFPETTKAFTTTTPGIGADLANGEVGVYAYSRVLPSGETASTYGQTIATLSNPVLGIVTGISDIVLQKRRAKAWVWGYSPTGYPTLDTISAGRPSIIASMVPLEEFPIDLDTGLPDLTQLATQGGGVEDLNTGQLDLHLPPFRGADNLGGLSLLDVDANQIALGLPNGTILEVGNRSQQVSINGTLRLSGVFVHQVLQGCILTFRSDSSAGISDPFDLVAMDGPISGEVWSPEYGDTLFVVPSTGSTLTLSDPPTREDLIALAKASPYYREGTDYGLRRQTGEVIDITQPSFEDPSLLGIKETLGQNPPDPMSQVEAFLGIVNANISPTEIPALQGQSLDDSGDLSTPYLSVDSEKDTLRTINDAVVPLFADTVVPDAQYPDEIRAEDGYILSSYVPGDGPPSALLTAQNVEPVASAGPYTPHSGIGDLRPNDIFLVEVDDTASSIPVGGQGVLEVGDTYYDVGISKSIIEPPRFVTPTRRGDRVRYLFENAISYFSGVGGPGMIISEVAGQTIFDITAVGLPVFDDGHNAGLGGLNRIFNGVIPFPNENAVRINLFDKTIGLPVETVTISGDPAGSGQGTAQGGLGVVLFPVPSVCLSFQIIVPVTGFVDFAVLGAPPGGPTPPLDYTLTVDTFTPGLSATQVWVGSYLSQVVFDRLSFLEGLDLRASVERGSLSPIGGFPVETRLSVYHVTGPIDEDISVNAPLWVNGGQPFTFLARSNNPIGVLQGVGTWIPATAPGAGNETGAVKVQPFEGAGNTPILNTAPVTLSGLPSTSHDSLSDICVGAGVCEGSSPVFDSRVTQIQTTSGAVSSVERGDLLVITGASDGPGPVYPGAVASTKAGSYLVRDAVESDNPATHPDRREVTLSTNTGVRGGWVEVLFPQLINFDDSASTLEVDTLLPFPDPAIVTSPTGHAFPSSGRVYVVRELGALGSLTALTYQGSVLSAAYTSINVPQNTFQGLSDYRDALGNVITGSVFGGAVTAGMTVSGMYYFPVTIGDEQGLPPTNVVSSDSTSSPYGLAHFSITNPVAAPLALSAPADIKHFGTAVAGTVEVEQKTPVASTVFVPSLDTPVFALVAGLLSVEHLTAAQWDSIHNPSGFPIVGGRGANCILPSEDLSTTDGVNPGYWAQAGLFVEPSWPRPTTDLSVAHPHVVDASHTLPVSEVGFRTYNNYVSVPSPNPEPVSFHVRRFRRFHEPLRDLDEALEKLRLLYETRRGTVTGYSITTDQFGLLTASGTNLGAFDAPEVGIRPGDLLAILDASGGVLERVEITSVLSSTDLLLAVPGITAVSNPTVNLPGMSFAVELRQAPVPLEQSYDQILDVIAEEVLSSAADYTTNAGGYVQNTGNYANDINVLRDTRVTGVGSDTFSARGVRVGDLLIIDPSGALPVPGGPTPVEEGERPFGDTSVTTRVSPHVAGSPSQLDDNRGFYRVVAVQPDHLVITGETAFSGILGSDVIFEQGTGYDFALYPIVTASGLTTGLEGQVDLRPTSYAGQSGSPSGSFKGNYLSIAPFTYRVVRPGSILSVESVDLLMTSRERFQSWLDFLRRYAFGHLVAGSYFIFQRDEHASLLSTEEELGRGPIPNWLIEDLAGVIGVAPYANNRSSLSCLGRRVWAFDTRLDDTYPPYVGIPPTYTDLLAGKARPVLPDRLETILESGERLRQTRYAWLDYRLNRVDGSFASASRFEANLPRLIEQQIRNIRLVESTESGS